MLIFFTCCYLPYKNTGNTHTATPAKKEHFASKKLSGNNLNTPLFWLLEGMVGIETFLLKTGNFKTGLDPHFLCAPKSISHKKS